MLKTSSTSCAAVDLVKELRLRRWARMNYVPIAERKDSWHPIVLDEMASRDTELSRQPAERGRPTAYVPLPPSPTYRIDESHTPEVGPQRARDAAIDQFYIHG